MKIITIIQTKGGSGKTTLAMTLASAALSMGQKVQMYDGDVNRQLLSWPVAFEDADWGHVPKPDWPENLAIAEPPENIEQLYADLDQLEASGVDLVIIDTRPGSNEITEDYALAADLVLIPARPSQAEWRLVLSALEWMDDLEKTLEEGSRFPIVKSAILNVDKKVIDAASTENGIVNLPKRDQQVVDTILQTPFIPTMLPHSRVFEQFLYHGPLESAAKGYRNGKAGTAAVPIETMLNISKAFYEDCLEEVSK